MHGVEEHRLAVRRGGKNARVPAPVPVRWRGAQGEGDQFDEVRMQSALAREYRKMYRNLNGLRTMNRLPECLVVFDPKKEKNAVNEARKMGITTVALIDTDCDPDVIDLPIPGNDDSLRSIRLVMQHLSDAIKQGRSLRPDENRRKDDTAEETHKAIPSIRD